MEVRTNGVSERECDECLEPQVSNLISHTVLTLKIDTVVFDLRVYRYQQNVVIGNGPRCVFGAVTRRWYLKPTSNTENIRSRCEEKERT